MKQFRCMMCLLLCLVMVGSLLPISTFATNTDETSANVAKVLSYADQMRKANQKNDLSKGGLSWDTEGKSDSWRYFNGAMLDAFTMVGTDEMMAYAVEFYLDNTNSDGSAKNYHSGEVDSVPMALGMFELLDNATYGTRFANAIEYVHKQLSKQTILGAEYGYNYWHKTNSDSWKTWKFGLDGLYMADVFEVQYANAVASGKLQGSADPAKIYKDVYTRFEWVAETMLDKETGLYHHGWNGSKGNGHFWGRGVGWYAVALVDVIDFMPEGEYKEGLIDNLPALFDGMLAYQEASTGMWYNVINKNSSLSKNKLETSVSAMMAYALMKAYNNGWVDETYGEAGLKAFNGTVNEKMEGSAGSYKVKDIYQKSGVGTSDSYYTQNSYVSNEAKGTAALIMAATVANTTAEKLAADEHNYLAVVTSPTCDNPGFTTYTCSHCGDEYISNEVAALGHDYQSVTTDATCIDDGVTIYTCQCGDAYTEVIPATGHDYKSIVTAPTCTEEGYTTYTCACGNSYTADKVVATGHDYQSVTNSPSCTKDGSIVYTCLCGDTYTEVLPVTGHNYDSVVTAPTCTEEGYTTYTCDCGDTYVADKVAALGHNYESETLEATCTQNGAIIYTCVCGDTYNEVIPAVDHEYKAVVTAPTCTEEGYTTYTCACGNFYVADEVAALGHEYECVITDPTCESAGCTTYTCVCGDSYVVDEIAALGHDYKSVTTEATCTKDGATVYTCHCGDTYSDIIPMLGHDHVAVVTEPDCETEGYTTKTCLRCGEVTVESVVAALGHDCETITVKPTCTASGSMFESCLRCDYSNVAVVPATGHDYNAVVTAPTCTEEGFTTYTCVCGDNYVADELAALGHHYKSVTTDATCTKDGAVVYTCHCGVTYTEVIPATGHEFKSVVTAPTCTEEGYTTYTCDCGQSYIDAKVAALGHNYKSVVTAPTCTEEGYTTYACACGESYVTDVVAALGHNYQTVTTDATCTNDGAIIYTCHCGTAYTEFLPATGHNYQATVTAPTCTQDGHTTYACDCGDSYTDNTVAAFGHTYELAEINGALVHTCGTCGHSYTENVAWIPVGTAYVLDTDGIDVGKEHKYIVVGADEDYALILKGHNVSATAVSISDNVLEAKDTAKMAFWFASNSKEKNTYLLTQDGNRSIYHATSNINYGTDNKGYWYFGSSANGLYQLYDYDNCNWYLNYGYAWVNETVSRFAVSSNARSVRLFKESETYARLTGNLFQSVADTDNATIESILNQTSIQLSTNGVDATDTVAITANMITWDTTFIANLPGTYTAQVVYQGVNLGTITVNVTTMHSYVSSVVAPTCTEDGYTEYKCGECGISYQSNHTAALGHDYAYADSNGYRVYTCTRCNHTYSEKLNLTYKKVNAFTSGERYVIVIKSGTKNYALSHNGNTLSAVEIKVAGEKISTAITEDLLWNYADNKLSYESNGTTQYLYTYSSGKTTNLGISTEKAGTISMTTDKLKIDSVYLRISGTQVTVSNTHAATHIFMEQ